MSSPKTRCGHHDRGVGGAHDVDFVLAHAHSLDQHRVEARGVHQVDGVERRVREAAEGAARCHGADEDAGVSGQRAHADTIPENGTA